MTNPVRIQSHLAILTSLARYKSILVKLPVSQATNLVWIQCHCTRKETTNPVWSHWHCTLKDTTNTVWLQLHSIFNTYGTPRYKCSLDHGTAPKRHNKSRPDLISFCNTYGTPSCKSSLDPMPLHNKGNYKSSLDPMPLHIFNTYGTPSYKSSLDL